MMRAMLVAGWASAAPLGGRRGDVDRIALALGVRLERADLRGRVEALEHAGVVYVRPGASTETERRALAMGAAVALLRATESTYAQTDIDALALQIAAI